MANCIIVNGGNGMFLVTANDGLGKVVSETKQWEPWFNIIAKLTVLPGDAVIDCGANFGYHSITLANLIGPQGKLVTIEPLRQVYQQLCGNMFLNNIRNAWCLNNAVGDEFKTVEMLPIDLDENSTTNIGATRVGDGGDKVKMITLDGLLEDGLFEDKRVSFIKLDVQGHEIKTLLGASKLIDKCRPVMMIENEYWYLEVYGGNSQMLYDTLLSRNYSIIKNNNIVDIFAIPNEKSHLIPTLLQSFEAIGLQNLEVLR